MAITRFTRRPVIIGGAALLIGLGALTTACGNGGNQAPSGTTTPTTTGPVVTTTPSPTEKTINPTNGNLFTPTVRAPAAPTEPPGNHHHGLG